MQCIEKRINRYFEIKIKAVLPEDSFTEELDEQVDVVNDTERETIMTLQEKLDYAREDGIDEGIASAKKKKAKKMLE